MASVPIRIPVLRPRLPTSAAITPYLQAIDKDRWYSNFGPREQEFTRRLCGHFGVPEGSIHCVANATVGLTSVLLALGAVPGALCMIPSWTFAASPSAACAAGLLPYFADVDESTWALTPEIARRALDEAPGRVAAVMPVAPFGAPIDAAAWNRFTEETGVPVVIDAAAGFDALRVAKTPAVVSLHATKALGIGEGGFVACEDRELVQRMRIRSNFGFFGSRSATVTGTNAKLSEYGAAVGLAALDEWPKIRAVYEGLAKAYRAALADAPGISFSPGFGDNHVATTCNVFLPVPAGRIEGALAAAGIETRRWWGTACHRMIAFHLHPRSAVPVTEAFAERVLGLPFHSDLTTAQVDEICGVLRRAVAAAPAY